MHQAELDQGLYEALQRGDRPAVEGSLASGADPNGYGADEWSCEWDMLTTAIRSSHTELVPLLIQAGASAERSSALSFAARRGDLDMARYLLDCGADPNRAIHSAAIAPQPVAILRLLFERGGDPNVETYDRITPLIYAAGGKGSCAAVRTLLEAGADVHHRCEDGDNALMWAASYGRDPTDSESSLQALLDAGADPNVSNGKDKGVPTTALIGAVWGGDPDKVRLLLDRGADPNIIDCRGNTALHIAAASGSRWVVEHLLKHGADPAIRDSRGDTPRQLAERYCEGLLGLLPDR